MNTGHSPNLNPTGPAVSSGTQQSGASAPSREIHRVTLKHFHGVRVIDFIYRLITSATDDLRYITWELLSGPSLACTCDAQGPDDVRACWACGELWCSRFHSRSCDACGLVHGVCCLKPISFQNVNAVVCKSCASELTASKFTSICRAIKAGVWD